MGEVTRKKKLPSGTDVINYFSIKPVKLINFLPIKRAIRQYSKKVAFDFN